MDEQWSATLRRWEEKYRALYAEAYDEIAAMNWEEAEALAAEVKRLGTGNCSWLMYHAGKDVLFNALPQTPEGLAIMKAHS